MSTQKLYMGAYSSFFIIVKVWKLPRCTSIGKLVYLKWNIIMMIKINEMSINSKTSRNFKCMLLSENNQFIEAMYCMVPSIRYSQKGRTIKMVKRSVVA